MPGRRPGASAVSALSNASDTLHSTASAVNRYAYRRPTMPSTSGSCVALSDGAWRLARLCPCTLAAVPTTRLRAMPVRLARCTSCTKELSERRSSLSWPSSPWPATGTRSKTVVPLPVRRCPMPSQSNSVGRSTPKPPSSTGTRSRPKPASVRARIRSITGTRVRAAARGTARRQEQGGGGGNGAERKRWAARTERGHGLNGLPSRAARSRPRWARKNAQRRRAAGQQEWVAFYGWFAPTRARQNTQRHRARQQEQLARYRKSATGKHRHSHTGTQGAGRRERRGERDGRASGIRRSTDENGQWEEPSAEATRAGGDQHVINHPAAGQRRPRHEREIGIHRQERSRVAQIARHEPDLSGGRLTEKGRYRGRTASSWLHRP
ncbi:hypothetical protein GA0115260_1012910 [Streptomyces sp. MnatMP-M27]|nr:hypothetical protein GA0115260_1012910 [Streptomyces sp. MnatMP-M27]